MRYWRQVFEQRLDEIDKYLCGCCERGWVVNCVVLATGTALWVCQECDAVWLDAVQTAPKASAVSPEVAFQQIVSRPSGGLHQYVLPYCRPAQPLTDWDQIKLAIDV
ncbi:hypothetical protein [Catellatospora tritici]|uniref:hypothetical protein n=1 Tax=Catellatospora tritici TaxID=2851566 RepID=UPI001C2DBD4F|nr:hypothetical protein [Catellatospora tritici]MBV1852742.1 hypothetical protein [Catellatospora tritici]